MRFTAVRLCSPLGAVERFAAHQRPRAQQDATTAAGRAMSNPTGRRPKPPHATDRGRQVQPLVGRRASYLLVGKIPMLSAPQVSGRKGMGPAVLVWPSVVVKAKVIEASPLS